MAQQGIVTFISDSEHGVRLGKAWMADLAHLAPAPHHLLLRAPISAHPVTNQVATDALRASLQVCANSGFTVIPVLHGGIDHVYSLDATPDPAKYPNAPLGLHGNPTLNAYIDHYSLTCAAVLQQLGDLCPQTVFLWNEANLYSTAIQPGDHCPYTPDDIKGQKTAALAPEVFCSLLYQTASRVRNIVKDASGHPRVTHLWPGALSLLLQFQTDVKSDWVLGYWERGLTYLAKHGITAPYPWEGMCLNMEGVVSAQEAAYVASSLRSFMTQWGISGPIVVGEWSLPVKQLVAADMRTTYAALNAHADYMFYFQHPIFNPSDPSSYGATVWSVSKEGEFTPNGHTAWYDFLVHLFSGH